MVGLLSIRLPRFALAAFCVGAAFHTLARYPDFAGYAPAWGAFLALFFFVVALTQPAVDAVQGERWRKPLAIWRVAAPIAAVLGAVGCRLIDILSYPGDYPTLHASLFQIAYLLLSLGLWRGLSLLPERPQRERRQRLGAVVATFSVIASGVGTGSSTHRAYPLWASSTTLGQVQAVFQPFVEQKPSGRTGTPDESGALRLFRAHAGLPSLPEDFNILDYNVLLVTSEATRFDETSLAKSKFDSTPHLAKFVDSGSFNFTRAYSPSSGTFQSTSGLFGMSYPSSLQIDVWQKPWQGLYRDRQPLVSELFSSAGYTTFWVGHNNADCFGQTVLGFERGFAIQKLFSQSTKDPPNVDARIANEAIAQLGRLAKANKRFFGWVFFVSPHSDYEVHFPDMPAESELDLYRQELRYMDQQFGKILDKLRRLDRLKDTIVIFSADHGEEFRDHGGRYHKTTVYSEVTHVPLVVWLPFLAGRKSTAPTSTSYLFPWLMQRGTPQMRQVVSDRLRGTLGPMMQSTGGAVVTELLGPNRNLASLIYKKRKYNYDLVARSHQAFDIERDPGEKHDLFEQDQDVTDSATARVRAYLDVRADRRAFVLRPDKLDPRSGE